MDLREREMPEGEAEIAPVRAHEHHGDPVCRTAIGTFVVAVLEEGDRGRLVSENVVPCARDGKGESRRVEEELGHGAEVAAATRVGSCWSDSSASRMPSAPGLTPIGDT